MVLLPSRRPPVRRGIAALALAALMSATVTLPAATAASAAGSVAAVGSAAGGSVTALTPRTANVKVTLVSVLTKDMAKNAPKVDLKAAAAAVSEAGTYWNRMSAGRLSLTITRTIANRKTAASSSNNFPVIMDTVAKEIGWTAGSNTVLVIFIPRKDVIVYGASGNLGAGWSAGPTSGRILMPYTSGFTGPVMAHEFGHIFGLGHANSLQCSNGRADVPRGNGVFKDPKCASRSYGDSTDLMGVSQFAMPQINARLFEYGGFGRGNEILDLGTPGTAKTVTLKPWAGTAAGRAAKFRDPVSKEVYYLQYRSSVGYDAATAVDGNRGVQILKADLNESESLLLPPSTKAFPGWYATNHAWQAGSTFTTHSGSRVRIDAVTTDSATVTVSAPPELIPPADAIDAKAAAAKLGAPKAALETGLRDFGAKRTFERGTVVWSPASGIRVTGGAIRGSWVRYGSQDGTLGYPVTDEIRGLRNGGAAQTFQRGSIHWSPTTGARVTLGAVRSLWARLGYENGAFGYPVTDEIRGLRNGGVRQDFERGTIFWSPGTGAHASNGAIRSLYLARGAQAGYFGYPVSDEIRGLAGGGVQQLFERGAIVYSPQAGAFASIGAIRSAWLKAGAQNGRLGYPTSNEYASGGGTVSQNFQGGRIVYSSAGARIVYHQSALQPAR